MSLTETLATTAQQPELSQSYINADGKLVMAAESPAEAAVSDDALAAALEHAARSPLPAPENRSSVLTAAPATHAPAPIHTPSVKHVVMPEVFKKAEAELGMFVGGRVAPELLRDEKGQDLLLTLGNEIGPEGKNELTLCFKGSMVAPNAAELAKEIEGALKQHPVFAAFEKEGHPLALHKSEKTSEVMLHLHIKGLTQEQYVAAVQALSHPAKSVAPHNAQHTTQAEMGEDAVAVAAGTPLTAGHGKPHHEHVQTMEHHQKLHTATIDGEPKKVEHKGNEQHVGQDIYPAGVVPSGPAVQAPAAQTGKGQAQEVVLSQSLGMNA